MTWPKALQVTDSTAPALPLARQASRERVGLPLGPPYTVVHYPVFDGGPRGESPCVGAVMDSLGCRGRKAVDRRLPAKWPAEVCPELPFANWL